MAIITIILGKISVMTLIIKIDLTLTLTLT